MEGESRAITSPDALCRAIGRLGRICYCVCKERGEDRLSRLDRSINRAITHGTVTHTLVGPISRILAFSMPSVLASQRSREIADVADWPSFRASLTPTPRMAAQSGFSEELHNKWSEEATTHLDVSGAVSTASELA